MGCQRYPCGDLGLLNVATERTAACGRSAKLTGWAAFVFSLSSQSDWTPLEIIALSALPFFRRPSRPALVYRGERVQRAFGLCQTGGFLESLDFVLVFNQNLHTLFAPTKKFCVEIRLCQSDWPHVVEK